MGMTNKTGDKQRNKEIEVEKVTSIFSLIISAAPARTHTPCTMRLGRVLLSEMKYFKRYLEREMLHEHRRATWKPIAGWKFVGNKKQWYYDEHRPWTDEFKRDNAPGRMARKPIPIVPIKDWQLFKGDRVEILVGKDAGKIGLINMIVKERNWVFVEALNCEYKMQDMGGGGAPMCLKRELPLLYSQVKLVDPADEKGCDIEMRYTDDGDRVRVSTRSGRIIPQSVESEMTEDFVTPSTYQENETKDMVEDQITDVTYEPKLCTFEEDIFNEMGIKEHRKRAKTYWY